MVRQPSNRLATNRGSQAGLSYGLVAVAIVLVSLSGYIGYVLYPRFDLPGVSVIGLFALAAGAGVASFFSPCSFPLLVGLLGRTPGNRESPPLTWRRTLSFAFALSIGAAAFLMIVGAVVAIAGTAIFEDVVFTSTEGIILRSVIGVLLILLGLIQFRVIRLPMPPIQELADPLLDSDRVGEGMRGTGRVSLFGFGYLLAGFG